jgi:hypothetical protein
MPLADTFNALPVPKKLEIIFRFTASDILLPRCKHPSEITVSSTFEAQDDLMRMKEAIEMLFNDYNCIYAVAADGVESLNLQRSREIDGYYGFADYSLIGHIEFFNLIALDSNIFKCAAAFVHEGMHQYMFRVEEQYGFFMSRNAMISQNQITSPWTANSLHYRNLPHATAVWYGLHNYWEIIATRTTCQEIRSLARRQIRAIIQGFVSRQFTDLIELLQNNHETTACSIMTELKKSTLATHEDN